MVVGALWSYDSAGENGINFRYPDLLRIFFMVPLTCLSRCSLPVNLSRFSGGARR